MSGPVGALRDRSSAGAAVAAYARAYDRFAEAEQMFRVLGLWPEAEGAHRYALLCLRAYRSEVDERRRRRAT